MDLLNEEAEDLEDEIFTPLQIKSSRSWLSTCAHLRALTVRMKMTKIYFKLYSIFSFQVFSIKSLKTNCD